MPRTEVLYIRLTKEEKDEIVRVAGECFLEPSTWARSVLLRAARRATEAKKGA